MNTLSELFLHELKDLYDAENQLVESLPKMVEAAVSPELRTAFQDHLGQTRTHVARLEHVFSALGETPDRKTCKAMKGLLAEGKRMIKDTEAGVVDAGLISAAQRVEHYEIAAYGTLVAWARTAGLSAVLSHLQATLSDEKAADEALSRIAESGVNDAADGPHEGDQLEIRQGGLQRGVPPVVDMGRLIQAT